ncbi:MAG: hypothetical protein IT370_12845 [Deltaproteobacteria bacterium]|nr:hypothetical protein [Deltaproteobacteria bacterium]
MALSGGRVGYLAPDGLLVWSISDRKQVAKVALDEPRALGVMKDGALLAVDGPGRKVCRLAPGSSAAECWPAVIPVPRPGMARVFGDSKAADRFWVVGARALLGWETRLVAGNLGSAGRHELSGVSAPGAQPVVAALPSGEFVALQSTKLGVVAADGTLRELDWPGGPRNLAAGPPGQVWVHMGDSSLIRVELTDPPRRAVVAERDGKDKVIYALSGSASHAAALVAEQSAPRNGKPGWSVVTWHNDGKVAQRIVLPWQPQVTEVTDESEPSIALSAKPALVAVADHAHVVVWDIDTGKVVFEHTMP